LRHPARIQPIIGTTTPDRLVASCLADRLELSREEWYALLVTARGASLP
jgi:predicted oxidoreductase